MRGAFVIVVLAACGGGGSTDTPVDSAPAVDAAIDAMLPCDPAAQTGCPDGQKCTFIPDGTGRATACRAITGTVGEGQPCIRGAGGFGDDNCAPGTFCTFLGVLPPDNGGTRICRQICSTTEPCATSGESCARLTDSPLAGMCGPTCTPFTNTCSDNMNCSDVWSGLDGDLDLFAVCRPVGTVAPGDPCTENANCTADHVCLSLPGAPVVCRALCDATHACTTGQCFQPSGSAVGACF
jgi:hypothetical protein